MAGVPASSRGVDLSSTNVWTGNQTAPALIASGLTGATAASRYVGATASGAPGSGTFAIGDYIIDQSGKMYVCTVAGTPGTWTQVGSSSAGVVVVNYTAFTSDVSITGTTAGAPTEVVSSGSIAYANVLHKIEFYAGGFTATGTNTFIVVGLYDDTSEIGRLAFAQAPAGQIGNALYLVRYLTPTAATHLYKVKCYKSGTVSVLAGDGTGDNNPNGFIRITTGS